VEQAMHEKQLTKLGYRKIGQYRKAERSFELTAMNDKRDVVYAWVLRGRVIYVGETGGKLSARFATYRRWLNAEGSWKHRNPVRRRRFLETLGTGVTIWAKRARRTKRALC
jgi:hypothetical protein